MTPVARRRRRSELGVEVHVHGAGHVPGPVLSRPVGPPERPSDIEHADLPTGGDESLKLLRVGQHRAPNGVLRHPPLLSSVAGALASATCMVHASTSSGW
ncbi:hypothetical protein GALL_418090 [mine drainage metagenome]|uniref:Uncharacterized protein n=1 Tax=mine drainage metagenome TaxID=410659 RepID=A0A1J5PZV6_9ZZZZ